MSRIAYWTGWNRVHPFTGEETLVQIKMFSEDTLIDWQREAQEEMKTLRFCPNCCKIIRLKFKEHKYYQNFYSCPDCGDLVLSKGMIKMPNYNGYSRNNERHQKM